VVLRDAEQPPITRTTEKTLESRCKPVATDAQSGTAKASAATGRSSDPMGRPSQHGPLGTFNDRSSLRQFVVLLVNILVALSLVVVGSSRRWIGASPRLASVLAVLPLLNAALLAAYVFGEDSYRDDGTSRWDAYRSPGGALGAMFVLSIALMVSGAALLAYSGLRNRTRVFRTTAFTCGLASLLVVTPTIIGFSTN